MFFNPLEVGMKPPPFKHTVYNALVLPRPIGWISTLGEDGVINLAPFSFFNSLSANPPCVMYCPNTFKPGTREHKDSLTNVEATGEFVFSMCTYALREQMIITAAHSPRPLMRWRRRMLKLHHRLTSNRRASRRRPLPWNASCCRSSTCQRRLMARATTL